MRSLRHIGVAALIAAASLYAGTGLAADTHHAGAKPARTSSGAVKSIDSRELTLSDGEQFRFTSGTQFLRNGQKVSRQDVKQGEHVKASYQPRGKLAYAKQIEILK